MLEDWTVIITACLVAASCSIIGCFLVLRKMAMVGDAISHAVLPGIVIAFMMGGKMGSWYLLVGAAAFGLITTFLIEFFNKKGGVQQDASIGVVFTSLFAIGIILISLYTRNVDLDQECVLYGDLDSVYLELQEPFFGFMIKPTIFQLLVLLLVISTLVIIGFRGLALTTFDPAYAATIGISVMAWHYVLMGAVSISTVISFNSVGAILVVAFLITPAATAYLISSKLIPMILLALLFGVTASFLGYLLAYKINGASSAAIATVLGLQFVVVFILKLFKDKIVLLNRNAGNR